MNAYIITYKLIDRRHRLLEFEEYLQDTLEKLKNSSATDIEIHLKKLC